MRECKICGAVDFSVITVKGEGATKEITTEKTLHSIKYFCNNCWYGYDEKFDVILTPAPNQSPYSKAKSKEDV